MFPDKYVASFIGFFPADNPQLCISIVMDEPKEGYYGGQVCGPVFKEIAERCASYLNIPPDENLQQPEFAGRWSRREFPDRGKRAVKICSGNTLFEICRRSLRRRNPARRGGRNW